MLLLGSSYITKIKEAGSLGLGTICGHLLCHLIHGVKN